MNKIYLDLASTMAGVSQARADSIHEGLDAAVMAREGLRHACGFAPAAASMLRIIERELEALRAQYKHTEREADRLANISNGLDRLAART